uniref:RING-type domain-containing protein n=2 Tax=Haptolina brevifila TaxID=156173 RepID=A0A7S2H0V5_9EUKA|mmetsp:Transcript_49793/g.99068  ORF Transcript_49793/g.99068 Transcript_49793/m.99068 type:complete len:726 (+) Transcript_49793:542-2719(+)
MRMGDSTGGGTTVIYFVSVMPRAEFLSEELMATTLRDAGLVPQGTLMVRRQLSLPPAGGASDAEASANLAAFEAANEAEGNSQEGRAAADEGLGEGEGLAEDSRDDNEGEEREDEDDEEEEEADDDDDEAAEGAQSGGPLGAQGGMHGGRGMLGGGRGGGSGRGMPSIGGSIGGALGGGGNRFGRLINRPLPPPPASVVGAGHVLGGGSSDAAAAEDCSMTAQQRREAALAAAVARSTPALPPVPASGAPEETSASSAAAAAAAAASRRQAAAAAAMARFAQPAPLPVVELAPPPPAEPPPATAEELAIEEARRVAAEAEQEERAARAIAAAEAVARRLPTTGTATVQGSSSAGKKRDNSLAARLARTEGRHASGDIAPPPRTPGGGCAIDGNRSVVPQPKDVDKSFDEEERQSRAAAMQAEKVKRAKEKEAIRLRIEEDRRDRARQLGKSIGNAEGDAEAAPTLGRGASMNECSSSAGGSSTALEVVDSEDVVAEVRVRCEDGTVLRLTLRSMDPISRIADAVSAQRPAEAGPFVLRVPFPRSEYATAEELQTSVRRAGLVPRGAIVVLPEHLRGVVRQAQGRGVGSRGRGRGMSMQAEMAAMMQAMAEMPNGMANPLANPFGGLVSEDADYEELSQLDDALGGDVPRGLSLQQLASLSVRTLDEAPAEEQRCCICCCEFVSGDKLMELACSHFYHPECISTWLAAKKTCPMCKRPALGGEEEE